MAHLNPQKLHVTFMDGVRADGPHIPRAYTLTHSDTTGDLFLSIGQPHNHANESSGVYAPW